MQKILPALLTAALLTGCVSHGQEAVKSQVLHRATGSWDGTPYRQYPAGPPVLSLVRLTIPANTTLDWHCHKALNLGYLAEGSLEVETRDGKRIHLNAGDTLAELVGEVHRGHTAGQPATVMVFHAADETLAFSTPEAQCPAQRPAENTALNALLDLVEKRLTTAEAVALHKWDKKQPVQATEREQQVLASVRQASPGLGVAPQRAEAFFADQMEANKLVQYTLLSQWHLAGQAPDTQRLDLTDVIRPRLDELQADLLAKLAAFDQHPVPGCAAQLAVAIANRPLLPTAQHALIRATGQLCDRP
ncbi:chorismate mutase [Pseudomonas sp. NBRC 111119]|uniref:chorismate mutase n=1 Tax=Pseudomonas sp. NBRC 111119 TaxID=1661034 RepID=UPI0009EB04D8|nr:chorismate mutase [Pseudomonas sp. NBRC 111119]